MPSGSIVVVDQNGNLLGSGLTREQVSVLELGCSRCDPEREGTCEVCVSLRRALRRCACPQTPAPGSDTDTCDSS